MLRITINDWEAGLDTVSLIRLLRDSGCFSLKEAKRAVEGLISVKRVAISISLSNHMAERFLSELESHHVVYEIDNST